MAHHWPGDRKIVLYKPDGSALMDVDAKSSWFERNQPPPRGMGGAINEVPLKHFGYQAEWMEAYRSVSWVYACVRLIAEALAGRPYELVRNGEPVESHPFLTLLQHPNPAQTGFELIQIVSTHLELTGNAVLLCDERNGKGQPRALWPLDPTRVKPVISNEQGLIGYVMRVNGADVPFDLLDIVHIKYANPFNPFWGLGTVEAAAGTLDSDMAMDDYNRAFFQNGARLSGLLSTDQVMDETKFQQIQHAWRLLFSGVKNAYRTAILDSGLKYQPMNMSQTDMDLINLRKFSRDEILAIFGVPGSKLGLMEYAGYKQSEADQTFWQETMLPKVARIDEAFTALARRFDTALTFRHILPTFDNEEQRVKMLSERRKMGIYTLNELREMDGKPAIVGGDVVYGTTSDVPLLDGAPQEAQLALAAVPTMKAINPARFGQHRQTVERRMLERFTPVLAQEFQKQENAMLGAMRRRGKAGGKYGFTVEDIYDEAAATNGIAQAITALHDRVGYEVFLEQRNAGLLNTGWDNNERAAALKRTLAEVAPKIARTTRDALQEQYDIAAKRGYSIEQLGNGYPAEGFRGLKGVYDESKTTRNETILRTETATAYNRAAVLGYELSGKVSGVQVFDGDTDAPCRDVADTVQSLDWAAEHPLGHPNCRRSMIPIIREAVEQ